MGVTLCGRFGARERCSVMCHGVNTYPGVTAGTTRVSVSALGGGVTLPLCAGRPGRGPAGRRSPLPFPYPGAAVRT